MALSTTTTTVLLLNIAIVVFNCFLPIPVSDGSSIEDHKEMVIKMIKCPNLKKSSDLKRQKTFNFDCW